MGGLAAAVRLARYCKVTLIEKNESLGGKLNLWIAPHPSHPNDRPFRFDTGPSLLTMPFVFLDLFAAIGEDVRDHLNIVKLDPIARFAWQDGMTLDLGSDPHTLTEQIGKFSQTDVAGWMRLLARGRKIWDVSREFLAHSPDQLTRSGANALGMLAMPFRIGMFRKFHRVVDKHVHHPRLRDVLYQYATYAGSSPWKAPATFAVIPWVEHYFGGWHITGGMYILAERLEQLAQKLSVQIRLNTSVTRSSPIPTSSTPIPN
jgi:phytoene desaturase